MGQYCVDVMNLDETVLTEIEQRGSVKDFSQNGLQALA